MRKSAPSMVALLCVCVGAGESSQPAVPTAEKRGSRTFSFRVCDAAGASLPGAVLSWERSAADADGIIRASAPEGADKISLYVECPGYLPFEQACANAAAVPSQIALQRAPTFLLSGVLVSPRGAVIGRNWGLVFDTLDAPMMVDPLPPPASPRITRLYTCRARFDDLPVVFHAPLHLLADDSFVVELPSWYGRAHVVVADEFGHSTAPFEVDCRAGAEARNVRLTLGAMPQRCLVVAVARPDGAAERSAQVALHAPYVSLEAETDSIGCAHFPHVPEGMCIVTAKKGEDEHAEARLVDLRQESFVRLTLVDAARIAELLPGSRSPGCRLSDMVPPGRYKVVTPYGDHTADVTPRGISIVRP